MNPQILGHSANMAKVALVTGSGQRLGAAMIQALQNSGFNVVVHYRSSRAQAEALCAELNQLRANSAVAIQADLNEHTQLLNLAEQSIAAFGRIDVLVNSASSFYPTKVGTVTEADWHDLMGSNAKAPLFLSQALAPELSKNKGCIINMVDIHAEKPLQLHPVYCMAKAALAMLTKSLAKELAPSIRVNGIAPGAILWPAATTDKASDLSEQDKAAVLAQIPLGRLGDTDDITQTLLFLVHAPYVNGQIIAVDGGRSLGAASKA
jgi:pteridine reductase